MPRDEHDRVTMPLPGFDKPSRGRPRTSPLSPQERSRLSQKERRAQMKKDGYVWRGFWMDGANSDAVAGLKKALGLDSQDKVISMLVQYAQDPAAQTAIREFLAGLAAQEQSPCN